MASASLLPALVQARLRRYALAVLMPAMAGSLVAAPPVLEALYPPGARAGGSSIVTGMGKLEDGDRLWCGCPGVIFTPTGKKREWQVTVLSDAPPGLHLVRAWNAEGVSDVRWFSIGVLPEVAEAEPNDAVGTPQVLEKLPLCVNARLDKSGDVDGYRVRLEAGQTLHAKVEAYALGSSVDVMLHILDARGVRVSTVSDGRNLDPVASFKASAAGDYIVQIAGFAHPPAADVRFTGSGTTVYRLHLTAGPVVEQIYPAVVSAVGKTEVDLVGWNLDPKKTRHTVEASSVRQAGSLSLIQPPGALGPIQVVLGETAAILEKEPNHQRDQATPVKAGHAAGKISDKTDVDRFAVTLKKGDKMEAKVYAKSLGHPLDATLQVESPEGALLTSSTDQGENADPAVTWTAAVDGVYQLVVEDQFHQGGPLASYVLEIGAPVIRPTAALADLKPITIEPGKTVSLKVQAKLPKGAKEAHVLRVSGLPAGVYAAEVPVPEKGEAEIKLQAAANAPAGSQSISVSLWSLTEPPRMQPVIAPLRGENRRGTSILDEGDQLWLIVKPAK